MRNGHNDNFPLGGGSYLRNKEDNSAICPMPLAIHNCVTEDQPDSNPIHNTTAFRSLVGRSGNVCEKF